MMNEAPAPWTDLMYINEMGTRYSVDNETAVVITARMGKFMIEQ